MRGVPANLPLQPFVGQTLIQVSLGEFQLQFHFHEAGCISVEGNWQLVDSSGRVVDHAMENKEREVYRVHLLLGMSVSTYTIDPPKSFSLLFSSGHTLTVFDDSDRYESFSVGGFFI